MATIRGSEFNDVLNSGAASDRLIGLGGDDTLHGGEGDNILDGGAGAVTTRCAGVKDPGGGVAAQ